MYYLIQITGTNIWIQENNSNGDAIKKNTMYDNTKAMPYSGPASDRLYIQESTGSKRTLLDVPMSMCVIDSGLDSHQS